ncbi:MAG: hypothetical protein ACRCZF_09280 [Gemmataceae bacterium]
MPPTRGMRVQATLRYTIVAIGLLALGGCKFFEKTRTTGGTDTIADNRPDPLLGQTRIPPTNLPVPGRDGIAKPPRDPLLGSPTGRDERSQNDRWKNEPFRNNRETTAAGLAGGNGNRRGLSIDDRNDYADRREAVTPVSGTGPVTDRLPATRSANLEELYASLRKFNAKWLEPAPDGNDYLFRCDVPIEGGVAGPNRRYEGTGRSASAAVADVLEQIRSDRGL